MEFSAVPWMAAQAYRLFGYDETWMRVLSSTFSIAAPFLFLAMCRMMLPPSGALFAVAAFAVNPLLIFLATAMQPDSLVLFLSLLAVFMIGRWRFSEGPATLYGAAAAAGGAILAKSPAAYVGLPMAFAVMRRLQWRALLRPIVLVASVVALVPPIAWYGWAHRFWLEYGNSMGVSNESHLIGLDILIPPHLPVKNLRVETIYVVGAFGWLFCLIGCFTSWRHRGIVVVWLRCRISLVHSHRTHLWRRLGMVPSCHLGRASRPADGGWTCSGHFKCRRDNEPPVTQLAGAPQSKARFRPGGSDFLFLAGGERTDDPPPRSSRHLHGYTRMRARFCGICSAGELVRRHRWRIHA
jgi:hypothetical protein